MKRVILILSVAALLVSCKMTRQVTTDLRTEIEEKTTTDFREETLDSSAVEIESLENEYVVVTRFSAPDSAGKQHIVSVTEINRNKQVSGKKNHVLQRETVLLAESRRQKAESVKITDNFKTETKTPGWVYVLAVLIPVLVFVFLWFKFK